MLAGRDLGYIKLWTIAQHLLLKALMYRLELFLELLAALFGVFTKDRESALELTGGNLFVIDVVLIEHAAEIRDARNHANRAHIGKRCRHYLIGDTSHKVTT